MEEKEVKRLYVLMDEGKVIALRLELENGASFVVPWGAH